MAMAETAENWQPKFNPWLIAVVVAMAAFMEVLDTSIANVALPHLAGDLGASNDESTWVLTSYLVSNAIVLPISGWLATAFGRKRFFMLCIVLFTAASLLCGTATSLGMLILFRVIQGAGGGGLQPMAQAILADTFPPEKRGLAFALYGVTAVMAPAIGPTLGGWLTDNYAWRWIFYINLPVGVAALFLVLRMVEDPPYLKARRGAAIKVDYIGIALLIIAVAALQVLLDKGQEGDWLGSSFIVTLMITSAIGFLSLIVWEWRHEAPVVEVKMFKNFNFAASCLMMFSLGMLLFSSLVMMPQFLQTLMGYPAQSAGLVLSGASVIILFEMPLVGQLTTKLPAKYIMAFGWISLAFGMYYSTKRLDLLISFGAASKLRMVQAYGLGFLFVPISLVAYVGIPPEKGNSVSGLINFMRNIGSSVGTSMVTTILARRAQFHQTMIASHTTNYDAPFRNQITGLSAQLVQAGASPPDARAAAFGRAYQGVLAQSLTLAYVDTFMLLAVAATVMFGLSFILRKNAIGSDRVVME